MDDFWSNRSTANGLLRLHSLRPDSASVEACCLIMSKAAAAAPLDVVAFALGQDQIGSCRVGKMFVQIDD